MTTREWHTIIAFGLLTGALAMYDGRLATEMVVLAGIVVVVRNATKIEKAATAFEGVTTL